MKQRILLVEDETEWSDLAQDILKRKGYQVSVAPGADEALTLLGSGVPDLIVLDINLKGLSGIKLCELLRSRPETSRVPILMLTCYKQERDKVQGLQAGADDYLVKPFGHQELGARVMALLRRVGNGDSEQQVLSAGGIEVNIERHEVLVKGKPVELRPKEFALLVALLQNRGKVLSKERLARLVWGDDPIVTSSTIAQHIKNLRARLKPCESMLETIETLGYKIKD